MIQFGEFKRIWEETVVIYFKVVYRNSSGVTVKNYEQLLVSVPTKIQTDYCPNIKLNPAAISLVPPCWVSMKNRKIPLWK
jgi:hypothetical protein